MHSAQKFDADTVLFVDDEPDIHELLRMNLKILKSFVKLVDAMSGKEAKEMLQAAKSKGILPGVILMDLTLGDIHGIELMHWIGEQEINSPVVILTGAHFVNRSNMPPQVAAVLEKDGDFRGICRTLEDVIKQHRGM